MKKEQVKLILFCTLLPLFLLLFSYKIVLFFSPLTPNQDNVLQFIAEREELSQPYTPEENSHLEDVRKVMSFMNSVFYVSLLIITLLITSSRKNKRALEQMFWYGGWTTVLFLALLLLLSLLSFTGAFTVFHELFFPQGNWLFPAESLLIQTFPLDFFVQVSQLIFVLALLEGSLFILLGFILKKQR